MNTTQSSANGATSAELAISGMTCSGCVNTVKRVLSRVPGVTNVDVDLDKGAAVVAGTAGGPALVAAVVAARYEAQPRQERGKKVYGKSLIEPESTDLTLGRLDA